MQFLDGGWIHSAHDLTARMGCDHRIALDLAGQAGLIEVAATQSPVMLQLAKQRGDLHEGRVLEQLRRERLSLIEIPRPSRSRESYRQAATATRDALDRGVDVVAQACFFDEEFLGLADFVIRGRDGYEIYDTKLARRAKPDALLQLAAYSEQLAALGHPLPRSMHVWLGDGTIASHAVDDVLPKLHAVRADLLAQLAAGPVMPTPLWGERRSACAACPWQEHCQDGRVAARDLSLVAGMRADQRRKLHEAGIRTVEQLGTAGPDDRPERMSEKSFERLRHQARLQAEQHRSRSAANPDGVVRAEHFSDDGLRLLPPASPGDVWFDMEGDPFARSGDGLEYLFGLVTVDERGDDDPQFTPKWAHDTAAEKSTFEEFVDRMQERIARWPDLHIYHYASYEHTALKRLAGQYGTREDVIDDWLRGGRLVDLMKVFKGSFRISQDSYSIKKLEPLYGLVRDQDVMTAGDSVVDYEDYLALVAAGESVAARAKLDGIAEYNEVDCVSTLRLDRWLRTFAESAREPDVPLPPSPLGPPAPPAPPVGAAAGGAAGRSAGQGTSDDDLADLVAGVPIEGRDPDQQARSLAHAAVGYSRRESRPQWWEHFERLDAAAADWESDRNVLLVDSGVADPWVPKKTNRHRGLSLDLAEDALIEHAPGATVYLVYDEAPPGTKQGQANGRGWSEAVVVAHGDGRLVVKAETSPLSEPEFTELPVAVFPEAVVRSGTVETQVREFAQEWCSRLPAAPACAVVDVLRRSAPRLLGGADLPRTDDRGADILAAVRQLDDSFLAVQGPPGAGKTHIAAEVITALVADGWRIGVVAQSHKAVENVLDKAIELGLPTDRVAKKPKKGSRARRDYHAVDPARILAEPGGALIGGTAWQFTGQAIADSLPLDLLIVDEAGQFSLGYLISVWRAARNLLLFGDPQQLDQVSQGTHPEPVDLSALAWLAEGSDVLPERFGYFLDQTRRMHPALTAVVSRLSYERRLTSHECVLDRSLDGVAPGVHPVVVGHADNTVRSDEEVDTVVELVMAHLGLRWSDANGTRPLRPDDILVVAPYNAQVEAIRVALRGAGLSDVAVGTVDRFQGQEAAVVIVSMTTSSTQDVPRGFEFVLSRNRLNVAISRAQWAAHVVHSPQLGAHPPATARELELLGAFLGVVAEEVPDQAAVAGWGPSAPGRDEEMS